MYKQSQPGIIVSLLNDPVKPILLLGAGASKQSGIKLVTEIVEEAAKWAYCRDHGISFDDPRLTMSDWKKWLTQFPWYTEDYSILYPTIVEELLHPRQARKDFFLRIINPGVPASKGYEIVAQLMHLGLLNTVLTANFDNCLYDAKVQVKQPPVLEQIKTPFDLSSIFSYTPRYPQLIYLHGSVEHYRDQNLLNEVQNLHTDLVSAIKPILKDRPLIVIGYRGAEASIMNDLFLNNLSYTNNFHQGIYWCILRREYDQINTNNSITSFLRNLADSIGNNFHFVPIDGFDELMVNEVWGKLRANEIDIKYSDPIKASEQTTSPTYDTKLIATETIGALEIPLLRERIKNYSERLKIKVYEDSDWLYQQMVRLKIAGCTQQNQYELTSSGILLFSSKTQHFIPQSIVVLRFKGSQDWLKQITSAQEVDENVSDINNGFIERQIQGNLWNQLNEITDALTLINRPFRLKGETSENVYPYPTLALKEVIVNSLVHRDYSINEPIIIEVEQGSISFTSPGGLVEEVRRQLSSSSIEDEIRKGKRGIKGYRNPVLADLFYGAGAMDKEGSGLSDVWKQVNSNSSAVSFGPTSDEGHFQVKIYRRVEEVDEKTHTAIPLTLNQTSKFACNLFEVLKLPDTVYFAETDARRKGEVFKILEKQWIPPFLLLREKMWSFYDLSERQNPLHKCVDLGTVESYRLSDFIEENGDTRELVQLLNESLSDHLFSIGLRVDTKKKRAYFTKTMDGNAKEITYQGRLKKATRTVAKPRVNLSNGKISYWEHKSIWYSFENIGGVWYLMLNPSYIFTTDGFKNLLKSERVNILSTKKASRDYNMAVHNDLTFWSKYIAYGNDGAFLLRPNSKEINDGTKLGPILPGIVISASLPSIVVNDISVAEEFVEPTDLVDIDEVEKELEELAKEENSEKFEEQL